MATAFRPTVADRCSGPTPSGSIRSWRRCNRSRQRMARVGHRHRYCWSWRRAVRVLRAWMRARPELLPGHVIHHAIVELDAGDLIPALEVADMFLHPVSGLIGIASADRVDQPPRRSDDSGACLEARGEHATGGGG